MLNQIYALITNIRFAIKHSPIRIKFILDENIFHVCDGKDEFMFCRRGRENRYKYGIAKGLSGLANEYHLDKINVTPDGVFIDCGANVGELGRWATEHILDYIAIEPEPVEAYCCDKNNFNGEPKTHQLALWYENTELTFYSLPKSADSSAFNMNDKTIVKKVRAQKLDEIVNLDQIKGTKILKLEAEGAEPEVLKGAERTLSQLDYVTVDCGHERGYEKANTFVQVHEILTQAGFEILHAHFIRVALMYGRTKIG